MMPKTITRRWGPPRIVLTDTSRRPIGLAGPVTRLGVVYQKMQDLTCVDPLTGETHVGANGCGTGVRHLRR